MFQPFVPSSNDFDFVKKLQGRELDWLVSTQAENGALPMSVTRNGKVTVNPYFANFAANALLAGKNPSCFRTVKKHLLWYLSKVNEKDYNGVSGTVYDYSLTFADGKMVSEEVVMRPEGIPCYDSTDSYPATFFTLALNYLRLTGDGDFLKEQPDLVKKAASAMVSTLAGKLTYARPDYHVCYLMDNCEVYQGLLAVAELYETLLVDREEAAEIAAEFRKIADNMKTAILEGMWREDHFSVSVDEKNTDLLEFDWKEFYPSASAQLFPILFDLLTPEDPLAQKIYQTFSQHYSSPDGWQWERLTMPSRSIWALLAVVAAKMGDTERVLTFLESYEPLTKDHAFPVFNAEVGWVILACSLFLSL